MSSLDSLRFGFQNVLAGLRDKSREQSAPMVGRATDPLKKRDAEIGGNPVNSQPLVESGRKPDSGKAAMSPVEQRELPAPLDPSCRFISVAPLSRRALQCSSRRNLVNGEDKNEFKLQLSDLIQSKGARILSYDVFDTLLLRNDKPEAVRYFEMSQKMLFDIRSSLGADVAGDLSAEDFMLARAHGMKTSYAYRPKVRGCGEGRIEDVVQVVCGMLALPPDAAHILIESEIRYEIDNLELNEALFETAADFRKSGGRVVLLSDMYLGAEHIRRIVEAFLNEPCWPFDELLSSADLIISKRSGLIFSEVENRLNAKPSDFLHIGDSFIGDVRKPRERGWGALHFPVSLAEVERRRTALAQFIQQMARAHYDVSAWAKL
jgi:hypothetical protein